MKKHGLLKILGILLLLVVIASYVLTGRSGIKDFIGLGDVVFNGFKSLYYFFYIVLFILCIGGFYGVLNKVPAYQKLLDSIVAKAKPLGKKFIFITILIFAVVASLTGMTLPLLIFVPFVISIILLLGYDKLVAITSTIVSIVVGYIGGIFVTFYNPNTYGMTTYETFVGLENKFGNMFPKLLLLFAGITLLIYFVNSHIKNVENKKVKYELEDNEELKINEVKSDYKKIKTWPLIIVLSLLFVILTLGLVPWNALFETEIFTKFHTWLMDLEIKTFNIIPNIISTDLVAFGEWYSMGDSMTYMLICIVLLFFTLVTVLVGRVKINDAIDSYKEGMKKLLPTTVIMMVAYTVLVSSYTNGFFEYIVTSYGKFNYGLSSLLAFLGCLLNIDMYYIVGGVFSPILNLITDETVYASVAILFQGIYGVFSVVGPTSLILIFALGYLNVPYTTWLRYIWRFILALLILVALVTLLVVLL
ncbi:MAG: hypothetical protein IJE89_02935 [Bacilli bacterium]|nr:hypothetical protein [Bacilli bacterium]